MEQPAEAEGAAIETRRDLAREGDAGESPEAARPRSKRRRPDATAWAVRGIFVLLVFYTLHLARTIFIPITLALLLSFLLKPVVRLLAKWKVPHGLGAAGLLVAVAATVAVSGVLLTAPAMKWMSETPENLHKAEQKLQRVFWRAQLISRTAERVEEITKGGKDEKTQSVKIQQPGLGHMFLGYTRSFLLGAVEVGVLLFFLLASGDLFLRKLMSVLPSLREKKEALGIAREIESRVSAYLVTLMGICVCEGALVGGAMYLAGMPNPVLWGVMAGALLLIPYLGALVTCASIGLVSLVTFDSFSQAILPPLIYFSIDFVQGNFITPLILGRRLTLNPVVVFISYIVWGWIWGVIGIFLAVPILMALKIFCDHIPSLATVGEFVGE